MGTVLADATRSTGARPAAGVYLLDSWRWFGQHTGYAQLVAGQEAHGADLVACAAGAPPFKAIANRLYAYSRAGAWCCAGRDARAEAQFLQRWEARRPAPGHVLYFERHHPIYRRWRRAPANLVTTIHHPPDQLRGWHAAVLEDLRRVSSALVLYQRDLDFFEGCVGRGRVRFVRHGVDTAFFQPAAPADPGGRSPRLLFVGVNGRNLSMLLRVVERLGRTHPDLQVDLLLPRLREKPREVLRLAGLRSSSRVRWHAGVSDEGLRALYQASDLLLLPLDHAGACNAIVEALACGLPVVTTDVGGVRDYGGGSIYPVVPNGDDRAMVDLIGEYLASPGWRGEVGAACRRFAEATLAWEESRAAHAQAREELCR